MERATKTLTAFVALFIFAIAFSERGSAEQAPVLGRLAIQGSVDIDAGPGDIEVSAPSYPYRGGERIATRAQSEAVLTLRDGSIAIAPETSVRVTGQPARYRIDLETGGLRVRFGATTVFELASGEIRMRFPTSLAEDSDAGTSVDVMIAVEEDGSFNLEVPANTPIELQLLDDDGMALRRCGWIWAKNHEPRGCIGCHEDGELVRSLGIPGNPYSLLVTAEREIFWEHSGYRKGDEKKMKEEIETFLGAAGECPPEGDATAED